MARANTGLSCNSAADDDHMGSGAVIFAAAADDDDDDDDDDNMYSSAAVEQEWLECNAYFYRKTCKFDQPVRAHGV